MIGEILRHIRALNEAVAELRGEFAQEKALRERMFRKGKVAEVDAAKGTYRQEIGEDDEGKPVLGPSIRYSQAAGARKSHRPVSVGQQMLQIAPDGDFEQAIGIPLGWSNDNKSPSDKGDEDVDQRGAAKDTTRADQRRIEVGGASIDVKDDAVVITFAGATFKFSAAGFEQTGGAQSHDGHDVGKTHLHTQVRSGPDLTGPPP